ncbi:MAG TPA: class I SAM-dependent methyltransferase [Solirubrobacteraceae bacterium]|jgi:SAM-dependent methyltransferase|nr:class I SAM-dependent methyltransferase [Solirubrobacteraceae bacterium]
MYDALAEVYDWLVPEALLTPQGSAAALAVVTDALAPGARILDCACGTGPVAVGLALAGFDVVATDASPAMVARTRRLAAEHGAQLQPAVRTWEEGGWDGAFDAVLCVGNSLVHAAGGAARRGALRAMAGVLGPGGLLAVTSRNWERVRARGSAFDVGERLVMRGGRAGLTIHTWTIAGDWDERHELHVAVALVADDGTVTTYAELLELWPFRHETLEADLRAAGVAPETSTYAPDADRYLVTARRFG